LPMSDQQNLAGHFMYNSTRTALKRISNRNSFLNLFFILSLRFKT
jgi:hypothetical protein